jgi:hypothetical protein
VVEAEACLNPRNLWPASAIFPTIQTEDTMGFGRGLLLWLIGIPLPIIILLAIFWPN